MPDALHFTLLPALPQCATIVQIRRLWQDRQVLALFASTRVVGQQSLPSGEGSLFSHLLLSNGEIFDVLVQSTSQEPTEEARLVLGRRDE